MLVIQSNTITASSIEMIAILMRFQQDNRVDLTGIFTNSMIKVVGLLLCV